MIDLLGAGSSIATDLLDRTASTLRVQEIVRLSLAPAFLLAAIGALMNVMMARLIWIANRIERLEDRLADLPIDRGESRIERELGQLRRRRKLSQRAVVFSTGAALTISLVIALLFVSAFLTAKIGTMIAIAWIVAMMLLVGGLLLFAMETLVAAGRQKD